MMLHAHSGGGYIHARSIRDALYSTFLEIRPRNFDCNDPVSKTALPPLELPRNPQLTAAPALNSIELIMSSAYIV
jgi:hypothetical protein